MKRIQVLLTLSVIGGVIIALVACGGSSGGDVGGGGVPGPLAISTSSLSSGAIGATYSATINASGGVAPYAWSISGSVPPGLQLDTAATGLSTSLTGTPTLDGSFVITVRIDDSSDFVTRNFTVVIAASGPPAQLEGYGAAATQGALSAPGGYTVYTVNTLADSGSGSFRDALSQDARLIEFSVGGTITLQSNLNIRARYLTVDGATAPSPGITIRKTSPSVGQVIIAGTHDIILKHLRFWGSYLIGGPNMNNAATIAIDGDSGPDFVSAKIVLDHITARNATDGGPDIWGEVQDLTISWCLFFYNWHPTTVSHYPSPFQVRQRISMHHNVYAKNGERNPQIRGDVRDFNYVNNVVYDWGWAQAPNGGYGVRIKNNWAPGEARCHCNLINNYFLTGSADFRPDWALVYGSNPGPDSFDLAPTGPTPSQGTVITTSDMGDLWVAGNILPAANLDHYSTIAAPLPVPNGAQVTTWPANEIEARMLPFVGTLYRDTEEQTLIDEIATAMP